jgi:hypothetical protein
LVHGFVTGILKIRFKGVILSGLQLEDCIVLHEKNPRGSGVKYLFLKKYPVPAAEA